MTEITVRGYHADFYGHVNNARYLEFFEEDRWAQIERNIDLPGLAERGIIFLVVNINVNYRRPVAVGETVIISTNVEEIRNKSVVLKQEVKFKKTGTVATDALVTFVVADSTGKARPVEGFVKEEITKLFKAETLAD